MSDIEKGHDAGGEDAGADEAVTRFLRDAYRAPTTPGYWDGLESRIMTRVRQSVRASGSVPAVAMEWWQVLSGWVAPGAWAAGIAALIALGAMLQARAAERRIAYAAVLEASAVGATVGGDTSLDDASRRPDRIVSPPGSSSKPAARAPGGGSVPPYAHEQSLSDLLSPR